MLRTALLCTMAAAASAFAPSSRLPMSATRKYRELVVSSPLTRVMTRIWHLKKGKTDMQK